VRSI